MCCEPPTAFATVMGTGVPWGVLLGPTSVISDQSANSCVLASSCVVLRGCLVECLRGDLCVFPNNPSSIAVHSAIKSVIRPFTLDFMTVDTRLTSAFVVLLGSGKVPVLTMVPVCAARCIPAESGHPTRWRGGESWLMHGPRRLCATPRRSEKLSLTRTTRNTHAVHD